MSMQNNETTQLAAILESVVDAIITIDAFGIIQSVNRATLTMFGYSDDELLGNNVKMLMPAPFQAEHDGYLSNYHQTAERKIIGIGREVVGMRKDRSCFPMHLAVSEIRIGDRVLFTGIVRDITDLKEAERRLALLNAELEARIEERTKQLEEAQLKLVEKERLATLGQVSGGIAHEIRNPLNALRMSTYYLLNANAPSREKVAEHLMRIDRQVSMIDNVVTALSDVARLPNPQRKPLSVIGTLQTAVAATSIPESILVSLKIPEETPCILADENQILIAFRNLLRNAREAMPNGGMIEITALKENGRTQIIFRDSGIGISAEHLPLIMQPLFSTKARGMGLGLAITKTIIEKNRGNLDVVSELGNGTTFTIRLESAPAEEQPVLEQVV